MRIHDQNPLGGLPGGSTGTTGTQGSHKTSGNPAAGNGGVRGSEQQGSGPDRVSLSNLAANLTPEAPEREMELERLSEMFNRGVYEPDPGVIAEHLIDEGLTSPPEEAGGEAGGGSGERE